MSTGDREDTYDENHMESDHGTSRPFRFKRETSREHTKKTDDRSHTRRRHHHRKHKRRRLDDDPRDEPPQPESSSLPPDVAFRESLFDALGDDEGAEFWQGVYGQPIHTYSRTYTDADTGELDTMDDEQYAQYVRRKMWEKSAEGLQAAREAKHKERKEADERRREQVRSSPKEDPAYNNFTFDFELEASLRRGQERREKKKWEQISHTYLNGWRELQELYEAHKGSLADDSQQVFLRNKIAWPVESGKRKDVVPDEIERFISHVNAAASNDTTLAFIKSERIRWHPDKIQQRYGFMNIEPTTMEGVTAVFQVLDRMLNDLRKHGR